MEERNSGKEMPHDLLAEKSFIASLIIDNGSFEEIVDINISPDDFYHSTYSIIYSAIYELALAGYPFDIVSLCSKLNDLGKLERIGGRSYIAELTEETFSSANIYHYGTIVKEKSTLRLIVKNAMHVVDHGTNFVGNVKEFINDVESRFFSLTSQNKKSAIVTLKESLKENLKELENSEERGQVSGLTTGFPSIDKKFMGMRAGQLIVIAARPGMGKTSLALNIAINACKGSDLPVVFYSYEMVSSELSSRILSSESNIDARKLRMKEFTDMDIRNMADAVGSLSKLPIFINDSGATTLLDIRSQCRKIKKDQGLGIIVIDYLQLMKPHVQKQSREQEIAEISRGLKELGKELACPIIALSQLNRSSTSRTDRRPALQDLRESGAIEQDADIVTLIHREEALDPNTPDKGIAEIIVAKNRAGEPGTVKMAWVGSKTKFAELQFDPDSKEQ